MRRWFLATTPIVPFSAARFRGERREVTIEDIGSKGDGIAYLDRGYILFVPETELDETVFVEFERVMQRFAVAAVLED
ncbi:TRAM domain-containing protein [Haladaptatus halobius]|uniref:TRAM domain-containing protein n=1 Tax=Haladaptatus halobius TaxID=2884875 RepID=UPI001D09B33B|nr:TRAM domain-containing protein [Haladaptatus halobius]